MFKLISSFLVLILCSVLYAQEAEYQLKGLYELNSSKEKPIDYTLTWAEEEGYIKGVYKDNFFGKEAPLKGTTGSFGRTFVVTLPEEKAGVKSIVFMSALAGPKATATTMPVSIITRDIKGNPLTTVKTASNFVVLNADPVVAQKQEEDNCVENFGALSGYCGIYGGLIAENKDPRNKCNLLFADAVRLELTNDGMLLLHLGQTSSDIVVGGIPTHTIGRIPVSPENTSIDILGRVCRPLTGVNLPGDTCKRLHLRGRFAPEDERMQFNGTYTISQEDSNMECSYDLTLDRVEIAE